jgi:hypothetical protein
VRFLWLFCAVSVMAGPITYDVTVNTSSISGTAGSLDFNFNPGSVSQLAQLQILTFSSDGTLAGNCPCITGDVTGQLPSTLTFTNDTGFNDYFDDFTYGTTISFAVSLYGPALSSPDGVSTYGSEFVFSMFSDPLGTVPVLTGNTTFGYAFTVDVNLDGSTTVTNYSTQTSVTPMTAPTGPSGSVPEPGTLALSATALACLVWRRRLWGGAMRCHPKSTAPDPFGLPSGAGSRPALRRRFREWRRRFLADSPLELDRKFAI